MTVMSVTITFTSLRFRTFLDGVRENVDIGVLERVLERVVDRVLERDDASLVVVQRVLDVNANLDDCGNKPGGSAGVYWRGGGSWGHGCHRQAGCQNKRK